MKSWLVMLADYNAWANERLFEAASGLSDQDYRADRGAFFGSMHGTLNHLLVADRIWMSRFTNDPHEPATLDTILYDDFNALRQARRIEDARIRDFVGSLDEDRLRSTVTYRTKTSPAMIEQELGPVLLHFFNHQTHHRGQAHCILTGLTGQAPALDLLVYQRQSGVSIQSQQGGLSLAPERRPHRSEPRVS
ncbi:DinB family protein [Rhodoligotrophos defluvii]|uniref:DinB family protein n=1 Tax=Rhodoligotrophos defluvii TaxID=2561934 RepID=UPI0010CA18DF|nr:DinB family protein [Rhodoligotrophos defluvii]